MWWMVGCYFILGLLLAIDFFIWERNSRTLREYNLIKTDLYVFSFLFLPFWPIIFGLDFMNSAMPGYGTLRGWQRFKAKRARNKTKKMLTNYSGPTVPVGAGSEIREDR